MTPLWFDTTTGRIGSRSMKLVQDPAKQTTAVTDIILSLAAFGGVLVLQWAPVTADGPWRIHIWSTAIGLIGLAAALGAVAHGMLFKAIIHNRIWRVLNLALALAVSLFVVGVITDLFSFELAGTAFPYMLATGLGFYLTTLLFPGIFFVFIVYEGLALLFSLGAYLFLSATGEPGAGLMACGVLLSIAAAGLQARKSILITLIWTFDYNGIYHVVQTVGLVLLVAGLWISSVH